MAGAVPEDDLPDELRGKTVPADDLPDEVSHETPQQIEKHVKKPAGLADIVAGAYNSIRGVKQNIAKMAIESLTTPVIGAAGALTAAVKGPEAGANLIRKGQAKVDRALPTSPEAQQMSSNIAKPFEMASAKLGDIGESITGGPAGRTIGENAIEVGAALLGAGGMTKGLIKGAGVKPALTQRQDAIDRARKVGYLANPEDSAGGAVNRAGSTIANPGSLDREIAAKNAKVTTDLAKKDLGIAPNEHLNDANIRAVEDKALKAYSEIADAGDRIGLVMTPDEQLAAALGKVDESLHPRKGAYPTLNTNPALERVRSALMNPDQPPNVRTVMETARQLREDAIHDLKSPTVSATEKKQHLAMKSVATALEDFVERKLQSGVYQGGEAVGMGTGPQAKGPSLPGPAKDQLARVGESQPPVGQHTPAPPATKEGGLLQHQAADGPELFNKYRQARVTLAKARDIREAANLETGHVDPANLAKKSDKLTGSLADIAQAHKAMGNVVKGIEGKTSNEGLRAGDAAVGAEVAHGLASATGIPLVARKVMASRLYQEFMANPTASSLDKLKAMDPALAMKAQAAMSAAAVGAQNSQLPPRAQE
jgi:hypothetical protein